MSQPNILVLMVDQLSGTLFPDGPADWLHTPNLRRLAARSTRYANAYTASPLCAPGRASFMSGRLPRGTGVYDNAAEFPSALPTFAHHLRRAGYLTCLAGKMHFVGPDQLHGFEERLTTDVYPADFGWTPDYRAPGARIDWWYHNMGSVTGAGVAEITNQLEYDDEVAHTACARLYDLARGGDGARPWCLTVSFTHPHDPYVARRRHWDLYEGCDRLAPEVAAFEHAAHDPHSQRIFDANDWRSYDITAEHIARARRAYFANISYLDDKIGEILQVLDATRQEAIVVFLSDHGDMLGERGLWFKMSFYEGSARVPLMISAPDMDPGCIRAPVSTLDVTPTLCALAGIDLAEVAPWTEGVSLAHGAKTRGPVPMEYAAEASITPLVALRDGRWKYTACAADPEQLFDLQADPHELVNLAAGSGDGSAGTPAPPDLAREGTVRSDPRKADGGLPGGNQTGEGPAEALARLRALAAERWDLAAYDAEVRDSQARRLLVYEALRAGGYYPWDYQPLRRASERFMRNHMDLNVLEDTQRFPRNE